MLFKVSEGGRITAANQFGRNNLLGRHTARRTSSSMHCSRKCGAQSQQAYYDTQHQSNATPQILKSTLRARSAAPRPQTDRRTAHAHAAPQLRLCIPASARAKRRAHEAPTQPHPPGARATHRRSAAPRPRPGPPGCCQSRTPATTRCSCTAPAARPRTVRPSTAARRSLAQGVGLVATL